MTSLHFAPEDWERVRQDTLAWWAGELERPPVTLTATDPVPEAPRYSFLSNYPMSITPEEIVEREAPVIEAETDEFRDPARAGAFLKVLAQDDIS